MGRANLKNKNALRRERYSAERAGFEPANLCGLHAFQACALSQTTRPLQFERAVLYHVFEIGRKIQGGDLCKAMSDRKLPEIGDWWKKMFFSTLWLVIDLCPCKIERCLQCYYHKNSYEIMIFLRNLL